MEQQNTDNPFRSISPLNLDRQISDEKLPYLILPSINDSEMENISINSPSMSVSSSNTNIDETLMMSTIDNLRTENASLVVENIMLEDENKLLLDENKELYIKINELKKKSINEIIIKDNCINKKSNDSINIVAILIGSSITTCTVILLKNLNVI